MKEGEAGREKYSYWNCMDSWMVRMWLREVTGTCTVYIFKVWKFLHPQTVNIGFFNLYLNNTNTSN